MSEEIDSWANLKRIQTGFSIFNTGLDWYKRGKEWHEEKTSYVATLREDAFIYPEMINYIDAQTNSRRFKFLSGRDGISRRYNSDGEAYFYVGNHKIKVSLYKPPGSGDSPGNDLLESIVISSTAKQSLSFTCKSMDALAALEDLMNDFTKKKKIGEKVSYVGLPTSYGDWDYSVLPKKSIDSVFLPDGVKETLLADIEKFLADEEKYISVGLPWHRGYCFYGEPGNGKSSIALALANHFALDLHNLSLSMIKDDKNLAKCISEMKDNSILLLEDIDVFSKSMAREQEKETPTLAGLLNALDGVSTPHGLVTIMTTNHIDKLDAALVRPGRMDYKLELKAPVQTQIEQMFYKVFNEPLSVDAKGFESMAAVADVFKRNLDDPEAVRLALKAS